MAYMSRTSSYIRLGHVMQLLAKLLYRFCTALVQYDLLDSKLGDRPPKLINSNFWQFRFFSAAFWKQAPHARIGWSMWAWISLVYLNLLLVLDCDLNSQVQIWIWIWEAKNCQKIREFNFFWKELVWSLYI